jgi:hypothetical protein
MIPPLDETWSSEIPRSHLRTFDSISPVTRLCRQWEVADNSLQVRRLRDDRPGFGETLLALLDCILRPGKAHYRYQCHVIDMKPLLLSNCKTGMLVTRMTALLPLDDCHSSNR